MNDKLFQTFIDKFTDRQDKHEEMSEEIIFMVESSGGKMRKELDLFIERLCGHDYRDLSEMVELKSSLISKEILLLLKTEDIPGDKISGTFKKVKEAGTQPRDKAAMNLSVILTGVTMDTLVKECSEKITSLLEEAVAEGYSVCPQKP